MNCETLNYAMKEETPVVFLELQNEKQHEDPHIAYHCNFDSFVQPRLITRQLASSQYSKVDFDCLKEEEPAVDVDEESRVLAEEVQAIERVKEPLSYYNVSRAPCWSLDDVSHARQYLKQELEAEEDQRRLRAVVYVLASTLPLDVRECGDHKVDQHAAP